jgi:hypothetical protein
MHARTIDTLINGIANEHLDALSGRLATTNFPATYRALLSLYVRTDSLKTAILDTHDSGNIYASKTLLRCLCEHYLKFLYIWARFTLEKSDAAATDYSRYCDADELREGLDILSAAGSLVSKTVAPGFRTMIETRYPDVAKLGSGTLALGTDQFRCRAIIENLVRAGSGISPDELPLLDRVIPTFAVLALLGRGGPYSDVESLDALEHEASRDPANDAAFVVALPATVFMFTALAISREYPEHAEIAPTVCAVIEQFVLKREELD